MSRSTSFRQTITITLEQQLDGVRVGVWPRVDHSEEPMGAAAHRDDIPIRNILPFRPPEPEVEQPPAAPTLTQCYGKWLAIHGQDIKPTTTSDDRTSLAKWVGLVGDTPIDHVQEHFAAVKSSGLTKSRQRKMLTFVGKLLRWAAEEGILTRLPKVPKVAQQLADFAEVVSSEEAGKLYAAAQHARWPKLGNLSPQFVWETWILLFWVYGSRTQDMVAYGSARLPGLTWSNLSFSQDCRVSTDLSWPHGWLYYKSKKTGRTVAMPLHRLVRQRLERFVGFHPTRVFPNGHSRGRRVSGVVKQWGFSVQLKELCREAGVDQRVSFSGSGVPSFRKSANQLWNRFGVEGLGAYVLGHRPQGVNAQHYSDFAAHAVEHIDSYPLPPQMQG